MTCRSATAPTAGRGPRSKTVFQTEFESGRELRFWTTTDHTDLRALSQPPTPGIRMTSVTGRFDQTSSVAATCVAFAIVPPQ